MNRSQTRKTRKSKLNSASVSKVGRPRKRPEGESTAMGFKISPELAAAIDAEAIKMTEEQPQGLPRVSRTDVIRVALHEFIERRQKTRAKPSK